MTPAGRLAVITMVERLLVRETSSARWSVTHPTHAVTLVFQPSPHTFAGQALNVLPLSPFDAAARCVASLRRRYLPTLCVVEPLGVALGCDDGAELPCGTTDSDCPRSNARSLLLQDCCQQ
jgi:hypothetical protein